MSVIKAGQAAELLRRSSTLDLADHLAEARQIISQARRGAEQIEGQARQQAAQMSARADERGHEAGYKRGLEVGRKAGEAAAYAEATERFQAASTAVAADLRRLVDEIGAMKADLRVAAEKDVLDFALLVAKKLTLGIGVTHREAAQENLRRAFRLVESATSLTVRVHPSDLDSIKAFLPDLLSELGRRDVASIAEDRSLAPGGCVVRSERTHVDAALETQLDELVASLMGGAGGNA